MSNQERQLSLRGRNLDNSKRIDAIEQDIPRILGGVNDGFTRLSSQLSELTEIVNALVSLVGEDDVAKSVTESRIAKAQQESDAAKAALAQAVTDGKYKATDVITEKSVIVGNEKNKEGVTIPPGRAQLLFTKLLEEFREKMLGQKVGFTVTTPPGGTFEVTEIYEEVPAPVAAAPAPTPVVEGEVLPPATELPEAPAVELVQ
jgi:hypothetical protein